MGPVVLRGTSSFGAALRKILPALSWTPFSVALAVGQFDNVKMSSTPLFAYWDDGTSIPVPRETTHFRQGAWGTTTMSSAQFLTTLDAPGSPYMYFSRKLEELKVLQPDS